MFTAVKLTLVGTLEVDVYDQHTLDTRHMTCCGLPGYFILAEESTVGRTENVEVALRSPGSRSAAQAAVRQANREIVKSKRYMYEIQNRNVDVVQQEQEKHKNELEGNYFWTNYGPSFS